MQANLVLESTDTGGKKQTTTITHIRPSEKSHATELAIALNALTTNTYVGAKVNEINVDITGKPEPILTIGAWSTSGLTSQAQVTYSGNGQLFVQCTAAARILSNNILEVGVTSNFTGTIYATETDNYSSKTLEFSR